MIGHGPGDRGRALDEVEPAHLALAGTDPAAVNKLLRVKKALRVRVEKIRFQRQDDGRLIETVVRLDELAESDNGAFPHVVARERIELIPFRLRESLLQFR